MCRILVIDDEEAVRSAVKRRLERDGYGVDTAETQEQGIEAIGTHKPPYDVVVTDMVMESPTSGLEVLQAALSSDIFTDCANRLRQCWKCGRVYEKRRIRLCRKKYSGSGCVRIAVAEGPTSPRTA